MPVPEWHRMGTEEVLKALETCSSGLSGEEARSRLERYGLNELPEKEGIGRLSIFVNQFRSFLVMLLMVAALFSSFIGHQMDALVIVIIVILNAALGFFQEYKAERALKAMKRLMAPKAVTMRDGKRVEMPARELVPGDVVLLEEGCCVPADVRVTKSVSMRMDESSLTGESVPVDKVADAAGDVPVADRECMAYAGTSVSFGRGEGAVVATGMGTELGRIAKMIGDGDKKTPLQRQLGSFGRRLGLLIVAISAVIIIGGILKNYAPADMVMTGIALAVAAVPEGLPAVVTITLALGVQRMAGRRAIVRRLPAVETLGAVDVICCDKTGTLTENQMTVRKIWSDGKLVSVTGSGYSTSGEFHVMGRPIKPEHYKGLMMLLRCAALCNNAEMRIGKPAGDPTEVALLVAAEKALDVRKLKAHMGRTGEVPFSSARKMMSVTCRTAGKEGLFFSKGAPEHVLGKCDRIFLGGGVARLTDEKRREILGTGRDLASGALRVLAFAYKPAGAGMGASEEEERGLIFLGLAGMMDPPRQEVLPSLKLCREAGIRVVMVTGDHEETARAIAREIGIYREGDAVVGGKDMQGMDDEELRRIIDKVSVFARVDPAHKLRIIRILKARGHTVAMTGDGVNDAPALKRADIGVAMGIRGTDVAKEASDMVLADDNFRTIVAAVKEGRAIYDNIRKFVQFLLSSNMGEILVIFLALLIGFQNPADPARIVLPLTAIQLLWVNLLTDGLPAVSLGVDPAAADVMSRPPRGRHERMLDLPFLSDILFVGVLIALASLSLFSYGLAAEGAGKAMTLAFTSLVVFELVILQAVKRKYRASILSNRPLIASVGASVALQLAVVYVPALQAVFGTVALGLADWLCLAAATGVMILLVELKNRYLG